MRHEVLTVLFCLASSVAIAAPQDEYRFSIDKDRLARAQKKLLSDEQALLKELNQATLSIKTKDTINTKKASKEINTDNTIKADIGLFEIENQKLLQEVKKLRSTVASKDQEIAQLTKENSGLKNELIKVRDRILVSETEVERLQAILDNKSRKLRGQKELATSISYENAEKKASLLTQSQELKAEADMDIVTVTARKANLRIAPSEKDSPLMEVSRGTRLVVETRQGEWYRVIAPTGVRAWIASKVVAYGDTSASSPSRVTSIKGFDGSLDEKAYGLISNLNK